MNHPETGAPQRADFRHAERLRVRWAEVDLQKIVFNGHYLMYFDTAVAGWWRAMAMPYHETMEAFQGDFYVRKATVEYEASARYDDQIEVGIRCAHLGRSSMRLQAAVFRDARRLVHGELVYVFADPSTQRAKAIPSPLRDWFEAFEAGASMVQVQLGAWEVVGCEAQRLRHAVFTQEQGIAAALDQDGADAGALHAIARNRLGFAVGTARLLPANAGQARIGRMAVMAGLRGGRVGRQMLDALVDAARARGDREVSLHAQASAVGFYARAGFERRGAPFVAAGIEHQEMVRRL
ncbi:MAG TPA: YbgC/FadM family acyl-CoA thioesterase [Burkholderiaceae bacterium]|nr:YbgC/FadM family acyl-CoA thioesterase [Burkholderiaceae bacterium]